MSGFNTNAGGQITRNLITTIRENREYLSEIDGLIGDGDHGINMSKGFTICSERLGDELDIPLNKAFKTLGRVLLLEIGGSMGPLYGTFFIEMAKEADGIEIIDASIFSKMLQAAVTGLKSLSRVELGDKTMMDTLIPAQKSFDEAIMLGKDFLSALTDFKAAAETGKESTRDLVAKIGRASRLGERSRGVLDAGATSCNLILQSLANSMSALINGECK